MTAPYFAGDTVPLKFTISDSEGGVTPSSVNVCLFKPDRSCVMDTATIDGSEVSYNVTSTGVAGHYRCYFICSLSYGERTHKIEFSITKNPER